MPNDIYNRIKSYKNVDFIPDKVTKLSCDYFSQKGHIVLEYDEIQHFTYQRLLSLEAYPNNIELYYDKELWMELCRKINRTMNKKKDPYRDEKRALYDSIRDIIIPSLGYKLIRIYHGQINFESKNAKNELIGIING